MAITNYIPNPPLINGVSYSFASVVIIILGVPRLGIKSIKYEKKQKKELHYGTGAYPVNIGYGKFECTGSIELYLDEIQNIRNSISTGGGLMDISGFDILINYMPAPGKFVTHKILNAQFTNDGADIKEGDTNSSMTLELIVPDIDFGKSLL